MNIIEEIKSLPARQALFSHPFVERMKKQPLSQQQVAVILAQWFHPLHYFPSFVSRFIGIAPTMELKVLMSKIVWQELGEGDPGQAHEALFVETMTGVGFQAGELVGRPALPATARLVGAYAQKSADDYLSSLGYLYATEAADLLMVAAIGAAVRKTSGAKRLAWVDIHVKQEPDHTDCVDSAVADGLDAAERAAVLRSAAAMFAMWCDFFSDIEAAVDAVEEAIAA